MTENPRRRLLRRARLATAGMVVSAVAGTAALTAVAAQATAQAGAATDDSAGSSEPSATSPRGHDDGGAGLVPAPSAGRSQAGTNAS